MQDFYVYFHRRKDTNEVFYVGKGRGDRAVSVVGRTLRWYAIACDAGRTVEYVKTNLSEAAALNLERDVIAALRKVGLKLVNFRDRGCSTNYVREKIKRSKYGSQRNRGIRTNRETLFNWRKAGSSGSVLRSVHQMAEIYGCNRQELNDVIDGHILVTSNGWYVHHGRGAQR